MNFYLKAVNNIDIVFYTVGLAESLLQSFKSFTSIVKLVRKAGSCLKNSKFDLSFMEIKFPEHSFSKILKVQNGP